MDMAWAKRDTLPSSSTSSAEVGRASGSRHSQLTPFKQMWRGNTRGSSKNHDINTFMAHKPTSHGRPYELKRSRLTPTVVPAVTFPPEIRAASPEVVSDQRRLDQEDLVLICTLEHTLHEVYETMPTPIVEAKDENDLSNLYVLFIQRRVKFLMQVPEFDRFHEEDKPKVLRSAVGLCAYISGAHLIDLTSYSWPRKKSTNFAKNLARVPARLMRNVLPTDDFVSIMKFYQSYAQFFEDDRVVLLMTVLMLFCDSTGLQDPRPVLAGYHHYWRVLTRYLETLYGPDRSCCVKKGLMDSIPEMKRIATNHNNLSLYPQLPSTDLVRRKEEAFEIIGRSLSFGMQQIHTGAMQTLLGIQRRSHQIETNNFEASPLTTNSIGGSSNRPSSSSSSSSDNSIIAVSRPTPTPESQARFIENMLKMLATCEDPATLAAAKRILPTELLITLYNLLHH